MDNETRWRKIAEEITGPCSCHVMYTSRGMVAPDCIFHGYASEIVEALRDEAALTEYRGLTFPTK